jgi:hypothetical protein
MKKLLLLLLWSALPALAQQSSLAMIPDCSAGFCSGLGVPTFNCNTGQRYAQIDNAGTNFTCTGIPPHWVQDVGTPSGVASFKSRSGAVTPATGDYTAAQVTNAADKSSASQQTFTGAIASPSIQASGGFATDAALYGVSAANPDNSTALTNAINAACNTSGNGHIVRLPPGDLAYSTTLVPPVTCNRLVLTSSGSGGRAGVITPGSTTLDYKGTSAVPFDPKQIANTATAIQLGTESTPALSTITAASRTSNVVTITYATNANMAALGAGRDIMVRNLVPADLNTEDALIISNSGTTITYALNGVDETASSVTGSYVDHAWNDNSYYPSSVAGFMLQNVTLYCGSTTRTNTINTNSYTGQATYGTGTTGIAAWRAPSLRFDHAAVFGCQLGFFGTNSDEDEFAHSVFSGNHIAIFHGPQDSQELMDDLYTALNDEAMLIDGAMNVTIRHWTSDSDGSVSTFPLVIAGSYPNRSSTAVQCYDCWFENNHGQVGADVPAFASFGVGSPYTVTGIDFYNPIFSEHPIASGGFPHTTRFAEIGNADSIHIHYPTNAQVFNTQIVPTPFLTFTDSYAPQSITIWTGAQTLISTFNQVGAGVPIVNLIQDNGGLTFKSFNSSINIQSPFQSNNNWIPLNQGVWFGTFNTFGTGLHQATGQPLFLRNGTQQDTLGIDSAGDLPISGSIVGALNVKQAAAPGAPTLSSSGTAGSTSYTYYCSGVTTAGGETTAGTAATTTTGNATLSSTNYNTVLCPYTEGVSSYRIYRGTNGGGLGTGLIGTIIATIPGPAQGQQDTGQAAGTAAAPATNGTGQVAASSFTATGLPATCAQFPCVVKASGLVTGQTAAIASTPLFVSAPAGMYTLRGVAVMTTAGSAGTLQIGFNYNNGTAGASLSGNSAAATTLGIVSSALGSVYVGGGTTISFFVNLPSASGTYEYTIVAERDN